MAKMLYSHLTYEERLFIEKQHSFSAIAEAIGRDRSTVAREI